MVHSFPTRRSSDLRQLVFDGEKERFVGNEEANKLLKDICRGNYMIPEKV